MLEDEERALTSTATQLETLAHAQKEEAQSAKSNADKAQAELRKAQERLKELQGEIMAEARTDYAQLKKSQQEADSAGMFSRRKAQAGYEDQLKAHVAKWSTDIDPAQDPGSYLRSRKEYQQLRAETEALKQGAEQATAHSQMSEKKAEATQEQKQSNAVKLRDNQQKQRALKASVGGAQEQQKQAYAQVRKEREREAFKSRVQSQERQR